MTKQRKINDRLDNLFSDLEEQATQTKPFGLESSTSHDLLPGWSWECDNLGTLIRCSPEIESVLGITPDLVIGQSLFSFGLTKKSRAVLQSVFDEGDFPCEIVLHYLTNNDRLVDIRTHIFQLESIDKTRKGWRGINQVISKGKKNDLPPEPSQTISPEIIPHQPLRSYGFQPIGVAVDGDQFQPALGPISSIGISSLQNRETISVPATTQTPAELAVPVDFQDQTLGVLEIIGSSKNRTWNRDEKRLVEQVADQLSLALENSRLFQETQSSLSRTEALYNVGQAAIGFENLEEMLQAVVITIAGVLPADRAQITIRDLETGKVLHELSSGEFADDRDDQVGLDGMGDLVARCIQIREPALLTNAREEYNEPEEAYHNRKDSNFGSVLVVPLIYHDQVLGVITAINGFEKPDFTNDDQDLLMAMSNQLAAALANARLFEEEQRRRRIADTLSQTARVVGATLEIEDVSESLLSQLSEVIRFNSAVLYILDGQRLKQIGVLTKETRTGDPEQWVSLQNNPILQELAQTGQPLVITDTNLDPRWEGMLSTTSIRSWIGAPLLSGEETIGMLVLDHDEPNIYDDDTSNLISAIAAQVSVAIRNAGLYQQVQRRSVQLQTAAEVSRAASSVLEPNPLIQQTVSLIQDRFDLYYVGLFLVDETGEWTREPGRWAVLRAGTGEAGRIQIERGHKLSIDGESMISECIRTSEPQTPKTVYEGTHRYINPLLPDTRSEIALPLVSRGMVIGAVSIQSEFEENFSTEDISILRTMADQVANALQNANLYNQTRARAEELDILNEMSRKLSSDLDIQTILRSIYLYTSRLVDTSTFFVALYNHESNLISFPFAVEDNKEIEIQSRPLKAGITEYVIRNQETVLIRENLETWLEDHGIELRITGNMPQSWLGVPLSIGQQTLGIICVQNQAKNNFSEHHGDLLNAIANQSAIVLQNAQLFTQTEDALADTEALLNITSVASSSLELKDTLSKVLEQVLQTIDSEAGLITIANRQTKKLELFAHQLPDQMLMGIQQNGLDGSLCDLVYRQASPLVLEDITKDSPSDMSGAIALGFVSYQGVTLEAKGEILGTLCTFSTSKLTAKENNLTLLQAVGQQIGVAIDNANLFEQTQAQAAELAILNEMSRVLSTIFDIEEIIQTVYEYTSRLMDTTNFFVALYDEGENELSFPLVTEGGESHNIPNMKKRKGLTQHVIDTKQPLLIRNNVLEKIAELGLEEIVIGEPAESWLGVPLIIGDRVLGVVAVQNPDTPWKFSERDMDLLISIARQSAIAIQTAHLFQTTRQRVRDLTTLSTASQTLASAPLETQEVASLITQQVGEIISNKTSASISLRDSSDPDQMRVIVSTNRKGKTLVKEETPELWDFKLSDFPATAQVMETIEPKVIHLSDPKADPCELEYMQEENIGTLLMIPLAVKGQVIGVIEFETWDDEYPYSEEEITLLMTLANQAAISLENARLYQEQIETAAQLRELDKLKSQFLANMSHELRTPLNSIIGFSRVIMKGIDGPVTDLQTQDLSAIYNAGQHLLKMINDILDISKVDAGKMEMAFEDINIVDIITSVMSTARGLVKDKSIELVTAIEDDLPIVYADPTRIRQILLNLLSNAAKFTDEGRISITARKQLSSTGQPEIYLSVSDTGIGIAPEDQEKLFEPFVQVDGSPTRATGGTGLGLSITRMLVELHNGEIHLDSSFGEGSTFYFTLPLEEPSAGELNPPPNMTVLAIDDDHQVIKLYDHYLRETDFQILPLGDIANALVVAQETQPFMITLDIQLKDINGWQILETLKKDIETKHIPIVVCSIQDEIEKGLSMGADDYLVKPILAEDFLKTINRIWETTIPG